MKLVTLPVAALEVCDRTRVRAQKPRANSEIVSEYAEAYECGLITEPLDVFREKGTERYIVADGEHRLLALQRAKIAKVECRLHEGDEIAALDFAIGCNQAHGLRRTERDRYHAFVRIMETSLRDKYRTDTELSEKIGVSIRTIKRYKAEWRDSEGGDARVRAKKEQASQRAHKHTSAPSVNVTRVTFQASESPKVFPAPARTGVSESLSAPTGGESETEPAGSDSRYGRQPPRVSVDGSAERRTTCGSEDAARDGSNPQSSGRRRGDASPEQWTDRDERAYRAIRQAWDAATTAARVRFMAEERRGV